MITYRSAYPADHPAVFAILNSHNLPVSDIPAGLAHFLVAERGGEVIGCVGLEVYGAHALLRSLAVESRLKNQGVGSELLIRVIALSSTQGIDTIHLLTTSAREYFLRKGFHEEARDKSPAQIMATKEFSELCPSTAVYMVRSGL